MILPNIATKPIIDSIAADEMLWPLANRILKIVATQTRYELVICTTFDELKAYKTDIKTTSKGAFNSTNYLDWLLKLDDSKSISVLAQTDNIDSVLKDILFGSNRTTITRFDITFELTDISHTDIKFKHLADVESRLWPYLLLSTGYVKNVPYSYIDIDVPKQFYDDLVVSSRQFINSVCYDFVVYNPELLLLEDPVFIKALPVLSLAPLNYLKLGCIAEFVINVNNVLVSLIDLKYHN